ncbi:acyl-CoA N-acyltransferase [Thozetella sp. PMI_491]|nr:acyl-CoA N-acyltransferase [Thozetella sp. PMI_491]
MPANVVVRTATEADFRAMSLINLDAFADNPHRAAMFPERLRVNPGYQDQIEFRLASWRAELKEPTSHFLAAVECRPGGTEELIGFALWNSPYPGGKGPTEEEKEAKRKGMPAVVSPAFDAEVAGQLGKEVMGWIMDVMADDIRKTYWLLQTIAVHSKHQRKGAGRCLVQWGIDEAIKDGKDIFLVATSSGRKLYDSVGFEVLSEKVMLGEMMTIMVKKLIVPLGESAV